MLKLEHKCTNGLSTLNRKEVNASYSSFNDALAATLFVYFPLAHADGDGEVMGEEVMCDITISNISYMEIINYYFNIKQAMWLVATQLQPHDTAVRLRSMRRLCVHTHVMLPWLNCRWHGLLCENDSNFRGH
jgi:hypothetical protein